jgi:ubiquinone/menaquinone biosynthesis C-methylase UbiE
LGPRSAKLNVAVNPRELELLEQSVLPGNTGPWRINESLGKPVVCWNVSFQVRHRKNPGAQFAIASIEDRAQDSSSTPTPQTIPLGVCIPCGTTWLELPSAEHWSRIASPGMTAEMFAAGGVNSAYKITAIAKKYLPAKRGITVVDWGVGCGRVAVPLKRIFLPNATVIGYDVDEFNIEWCKNQLSDVRAETCDYFPPLELAAQSVDLMYGISVMTHLTQAAQEIWLREIKRIMKPNGVCILSVHGDYSLLGNRGFSPIVFQQLKAFGISDISYNWDGLGPKLSLKGYYRGTFQLRQQVEEAWSKHFQIVEYLPAANELNQDFVVLKRI